MIVVVSDLHLQHTSQDAVRFRDGKGHVVEAGVRRNVGKSALALLLDETIAHVTRAGAKELHLVFAGDIFELHRTPLWFSGGGETRPYTKVGDDGGALRDKVLEVLDAIERDNGDFFALLADFVANKRVSRDEHSRFLPDDFPISVHYLPGNHDRLANGWPEVRGRIRELLSMPGGTDHFEHTFERRLVNGEGYGVLVRHGHEYDRLNLGVEPTSAPLDHVAYLAPCFGDFMTIDVAGRLATAFRAHHALALREASANGARLRSMYAALTEFDDVRPFSLLPRYLADCLGVAQDAVFEVLRPVLVDCFSNGARDPFLAAEAKRLDFAKAYGLLTSELVEVALKNLSAASMRKLIDLVVRARSRGEDTRPAAAASKEPLLGSGDIDLVVAGHTHDPDQVAIRAKDAAGFFLDSGTWRTRIDSKHEAFGRLRSYTMVFVYRHDEMAGDRRRFETWTGHLSAESYGPYEERRAAAPDAKPATLTLTSCKVHRVDEGSTKDGAELRLRFGVDGVGRTFEIEGVHDGDLLDLASVAPIALDRELDGELWCVGEEVDGGLFDPDDPLPWGVVYLPRNDDGSFVGGPATLRLASLDGTRLDLSYVVAT